MKLTRRAAAAAHDALLGGWAFLRRNRRIRPTHRPVKVNLGSGLVVAPGWINIDAGIGAAAAGWPRAAQRMIYRLLPASSAARRDYDIDRFCAILSSGEFRHHRLEFGLPFADGTVDYLYASHVLEHLFASHANRLLRECHRVLRQGGVLRVGVPDLAHAIELFRRGETEAALEYFFQDIGPSRFTRHRYMYDEALLTARLEQAGFARIRRCAYREGDVPDLELLDNRPEETLFIEATR